MHKLIKAILSFILAFLNIGCVFKAGPLLIEMPQGYLVSSAMEMNDMPMDSYTPPEKQALDKAVHSYNRGY